jgi:hypothetical protein
VAQKAVGSSPIIRPICIMNSNPESPDLSSERDGLVAKVGERALENIVLQQSGTIQTELDKLGVKSRLRRQQLFPQLTALGGQTMTCVDLILGVRQVVETHNHSQASGVAAHLNGIQSARYTEILTGEVDDETRATLRSIWSAIISQPSIKSGDKVKQQSGKQSKRKDFSKFSGQPSPSVKPKQPNRYDKRKKFDPARSSSFKLSANQHPQHKP